MTTLSNGRGLLRFLTWVLGLTALAWCITATGAIPAGERAALIDLYNSTNGAGWNTKTNWNGAAGTECTWYGVVCNAGETTVESIGMDSNNLTGTLPVTLSNLTNLRWLELTRNYSLGGPIPATLATLANLQGLNLYFNALTGTIPSALGGIPSLISLELNDNQLTGSIPAELGNLANLEGLRVDSNQLTGSIPPELANLSKLRFLATYGNPLTGPIPAALGNLTTLTHLFLGDQLSGPIPAELGNLVNLVNLGIAGQMTGTIPAQLGNLAQLQLLQLSPGELTGPIPAQLGNLTQLTNLYLANNQLSGSIPVELGNLANLQYLNLSNNQLTGSIPAQLGNLANLQYLDFYRNQVSGPIPSSLGNLASLKWLTLSNNQLSGSIPAAIGNLANATNVYLDSNQLTGAIPPEIGNLTKLQDLSLGQNQLTGTVPSGIENLAMLQRLVIADNQLSGPLPTFAGLTNVGTLDLAGNQFTGSFPLQYAALPKLSALYLSQNRLTGALPAGISTLTKLVVLRIAGNNFVGPIPSSITGMTGLQVNGIDFRFNGLYSSDPAVVAFVTARQSDWQNFQTVPVANLAPGSATASSVALTWTPILYTGDTGGYRVYYTTTPGGPYTLFETTTDKSATGAVVTGLAPATPYHFVVRSVTEANPNNQNVVVSDPSAEVSKATTSGVATPAIVTSTPLPTGVEGIAYDQTFSATGGTPPYTNWQLTAGALPAGLTLDPSIGRLSGTPTAAGSFAFTVQVKDSVSVTGTKAFALTINTPLSIATSPSLPAAVAGSYYSQALAASGGLPPYSNWQVISGSLPPGLVLSAATGVLSGTPAASGGPFAFTVQVSDGSGLSVTLAMSLLVNAGAVVDAAPIPVLGPLALLLLSAVLGVAGIAATRRRRT